MAGKHTKRIQECKRNDKEFGLETSETFFFSLDSHPITVGYFFKINEVKAQKKKKKSVYPIKRYWRHSSYEHVLLHHPYSNMYIQKR